jgi:hypothetical protein
MAAGARAGFAGQHYIIGIMQSVAGKGSINKNYGNPFPAPTRTTVLHNAPLCKVGLWRATRHLASLFQAWLGGFWESACAGCHGYDGYSVRGESVRA